MTVTTTTASQTFQGNGVATAFPCAFEILENTDINVFFVNPSTGTQTQAVLNSDYTVAGAGAAGGFTVNATVPVATGTNLYVVRALPLTQPTDFTNQGAFFPTLHEAAFDRLCMLIQQIANYSEGLNVTMPPGLVPQPSTLFPIPQAGSLIGWNAAGTALVNTGPSTGAGAISDINVATNAAIQATKINFTQPPSNQFFAQNGAVINRFNDRIFLGGATLNDGIYPSGKQDWFSQWQSAESGFGNYALAGDLVVFNGTNPSDAAAIIAAVQSLNFTASGTACIPVGAYAVNNNTTLATAAWAFYGEAHHTTAAAGTTYAMELDTRTLTPGSQPDPFTQGAIVALQLASGAGVSATGQYDASTAIQIEQNPMKFHVGIVFGADSITGADGTGGANQGTAMALGPGHKIEWYASAAHVAAQILCNNTTTTNATGINFTNIGMQVYSIAPGNPAIAYFSAATSAVNYLSFIAESTGVPPIIFAAGTDTNVDLWLRCQGTGAVWLGAYTASAPTATGYITVKDTSGNVRKLLCA